MSTLDRAWPWLERLCSPHADGSAALPILMVVAHPDDEVVGAGGQLSRWRNVSLAHVTDGAPRDLGDAHRSGCTTREDYAALRRQELIAAMSLVGLEPARLHRFNVVDQEATRALVDVTRRLERLLLDIAPRLVLTHPYEGGHPDHDATAFAVHSAARFLARRGHDAPCIVEMTSYHGDGNSLETGCFLPHRDSPRAMLVRLDAARQLEKQRLLDCFVSQRQTLQWFSRDYELFRPAPCYNFGQPPHPGRLFYEAHPWGMTGERFRDCARVALRELDLVQGS